MDLTSRDAGLLATALQLCGASREFGKIDSTDRASSFLKKLGFKLIRP